MTHQQPNNLPSHASCMKATKKEHTRMSNLYKRKEIIKEWTFSESYAFIGYFVRLVDQRRSADELCRWSSNTFRSESCGTTALHSFKFALPKATDVYTILPVIRSTIIETKGRRVLTKLHELSMRLCNCYILYSV